MMFGVNKIRIVQIVILLLFLATFACRTQSVISDKNLSVIYDNSGKLNVENQAYHISDDSTLFFLRVSAKNLLYTNENGTFSAGFRVKLLLYDVVNLSLLVDSASTVLNLIRNENDSTFEVEIPLATPAGKKYFLQTIVYDLNRSINKSAYLDIDKMSVNSPQNFIFKNVRSNQLLFGSVAQANEPFRIESIRNKGKLFYLSYYNRNYQYSSPPFAINQHELISFDPDSIFSSDGKTVALEKKGFYQIRTDKTQRSGATLFIFHDDYPNLSRPDQLLKPLRFLTTQAEYKNIIGSLDQKTQIDNFWINAAGNNRERAKKIIKIFYNNVQEANIYFTSYKEGWKTDRGMIYLIYGKPDLVKRTAKTETWTYRKSFYYNTVIFVFNKTGNYFSDNDYYLDRSPEYRESWYVEVENWRKGYLKQQ